MYSLIVHQLKAFLDSYDGEIGFAIVGDSEIVLNQISKMPYLFKSWTGSRLQEIKENVPNLDVDWLHVRSEHNCADCLTREFYKIPSELPWAKFSMNVDESSFRNVNTINVRHLPEVNKKEVSIQTASLSMPSSGLSSLQRFLSVQMPLVRLEKRQAQTSTLHPGNKIVMKLLENCNYLTAVNALARIFKWKSKEIMSVCQENATNLIFTIFQMQQADYVRNFRGNTFTMKNDGNLCTILVGWDTCYGSTQLKLIPHNTLLCEKICEYFHNKCHGSDSYVRSDILKNNMYLPHALKILAKYRKRCTVCRKRAQKQLITKMGQIGENRLNHSSPFQYLQSDLIGPFFATEFVNQRRSRKIWIMTSICHFSR